MRISDWSSDVCSSDLMNGTMTGIGDACLDNDCTILFFGGFGGSEDRIGMTYQTVDNNNFRTAERIQGAVAFAAVDGSGGTDPDPDPTPDPVVNDGIDRKSTRLNSSH